MPTIKIDEDCFLRSVSTPRQLVVFLHGVGANGLDLMSMANEWKKILPDADFISPNAPFPYDDGSGYSYQDAYQWFSLEGVTHENRAERVKPASELLNQFIDEQLALRHLSEDCLAWVGFSQGTIMALYTALRRSSPCGSILGYSGRLTGEKTLPQEITSKPPIFLVHGQEDAVIPLSETLQASHILKSLNVPVLTWTVPKIPHAISKEAERVGGRFLKHCFENRNFSEAQPLFDQEIIDTFAFPKDVERLF
ncbi:MAG: phospholipase [Cyanobacteria bacterium]|nr:phospholipase [Cyanobacteriota bacterium]